ncbi:Hypothetical predicted protein [Lecanosticta acicola]|uniref:Uncharacterized protein n=1 Tax=Lecanosticta acicola TaxID=111012 RepID=A0AAI8YR66_9PEZI|nr:Hypothetical predicted protein [Lecanosticta acicola]
MNCKQDRSSPYVLASKPSASLSAVSSAASATSAGTSRSGGSRLLFGEIDTSSERSSESYASVCSFVLCDSSTFLKFWLEDRCRETFLSFLPKHDLASLRLACHDFSVRAAPALFNDLKITFKTNTFTKPSRLAALDRLGFYVKTVRFEFPHTSETFLPPLVDPETGAELSFTYTPPMHESSSLKRPKYGDLGTTEILTRQYPPIFHAATNVPAFVRAFSAFVNLEHLAISCPGYQAAQRYRRSTVDYALISLRIAIEKNSLNALEALTLAPIHPGGLLYLSPMLGFGASPRSASRWARIRKLTIHADTLLAPSPPSAADVEPDHFKLLQTFLRNFQPNLHTLHFRWLGGKGAFPVKASPPSSSNLCVSNVTTTAAEIRTFLSSHKRKLQDLNLEDFHLARGTWDEALRPLTARHRHRQQPPMKGEIPIMLFPAAMERVGGAEHGEGGGRLRMSSTASISACTSTSTSRWGPLKAKKVREGLLGCEMQLRKVLRGSAFPWK